MSPSGDGAAVDGRCCACFSGENGGLRGEDACGMDNSKCSNCARPDPPSSSFSSFLLDSDAIPLKDWEKLRRIIIASAKGFSIGIGLKGGLALFSILARLRRSPAARYLNTT